jgi:hypothetical protein
MYGFRTKAAKSAIWSMLTRHDRNVSLFALNDFCSCFAFATVALVNLFSSARFLPSIEPVDPNGVTGLARGGSCLLFKARLGLRTRGLWAAATAL